jgi:secreted Zn-dependent insulinase-like peptidase
MWSEMKACADLDFWYQEKSDASSLAPALASNLNFYPEEHIVSVGSVFDDIDSNDISLMRSYMDLLKPRRSIIYIRNQV